MPPSLPPLTQGRLSCQAGGVGSVRAHRPGHARSCDRNEASTSPPGVISQARGAARMGVLPRSERSISQHVGLSSHHYQQLLLLYKIGSSIDRGQAKFAPVALGHARHGYIYIYAVRAGLPAAALACVWPAWLRRAACFASRGVARMCRFACICSGSLQRSALAQARSASGGSPQLLCVLRCARPHRVGSFAC